MVWFLVLACGDTPDWSLDGLWEGGVICGSSWLDMSLDLAETGDFEADGPGDVSFTDGAGSLVTYTFELVASFNEPADDAVAVPLEIDFEDCAEASFGGFECWDASGTWDVVDDELRGSLPGFPISGGGCRYEIEREA